MHIDAALPETRRIVYSFDVFDTCITRLHAFPSDLFYELGLIAAPEGLGRRGKHRFAKRFQAQRIRAERKAHRLARPRQAVSIEEIYQQLPIPEGFNAHDLMQREVELEREGIYPVPAVISRIEQLRDAGYRIIFISDMYLPSRTLGPILKELGVMREGDGLYVSCDAGLTKHHGELFQHVLQTEGLRASELIHAGDNPRADVRMAAHARIKAHHVRDAVLTGHEFRLAGRQLPRLRGRSFHAAFARRLRLSRPSAREAGQQVLDSLIHGIIVPFLLTYVMWVLDDAKRHGVRRLYFVARDGEILYRIACALQGADDSIDLRYLYGSRRAWQPASFIPGTTDLHRLLVVAGQGSSRNDITARLGLNNAAQETLRQALGGTPEQWSTPLSHGESRLFLSDLQGHPSAMDEVLRSVQRERDAALAYFFQEGLFDDTSWALVDAGWSLNCQAALKRTLEVSGRSHHVPKGYYLALARGHLDGNEAGEAKAYVAQTGSIFSRRAVVIEHCFMPSTHATTRSYRIHDNQAEPVLGQEVRGETELAYARDLQDAAISAALLVAANKRISASLAMYSNDIRSAAEQLLKKPSRAQASAMSGFGTVADMRHERSFVKPLCRPLQFKDVLTALAMGLSPKKNFQSPSYMWLEGSAALSPPHVRLPLKLLLLGDDLSQWLREKRRQKPQATPSQPSLSN